MLQAGVLKPVEEATPCINSFYLVEGKDESGNWKLRICLDPINLNKAIVREPCHFKKLEDIGHLIVDACIMAVCDCKKGYWHQQLDEASLFLTAFSTKLERFRYTVMPFGATVAGDVFSMKGGPMFGTKKESDCNSRWYHDCGQENKPQHPWPSTNNTAWNSYEVYCAPKLWQITIPKAGSWLFWRNIYSKQLQASSN